MAELKRVAKAMRDFLLREDLAHFDEFARIAEGRLAKKLLSDKITTDEVEALYLLARQEARSAGSYLAAGCGRCVVIHQPERSGRH